MKDWVYIASLIHVPHYNRYCRHTIRGYAADFVNRRGEYVFYDEDTGGWYHSMVDDYMFSTDYDAYLDLIERITDGDSD